MKKISFLKKTLTFFAASLLTAPVLAGWTVKDGKLLDAKGQPFVFRGASVNNTLTQAQKLQAIKDIAAAGANAVKVGINAHVYQPIPNTRGRELSAIIETCKANKVVCILEPNDMAGYPASPQSAGAQTVAYYWAEFDIASAISGNEDYIILGAGNQAVSDVPTSQYVSMMDAFLLRYTTFELKKFLIMVDGNGWGQDADKAMIPLAQALKRYGTFYPTVIYSVDMFDKYTDPESVRSYMASFAEAGVPLVVGDFAPTPYYHPHNSQPIAQAALRLPAEAVMQYAEQYGVGYLGWSWSGNSNSALDLVNNYDANALTHWGNILFNDPNGIKTTAKPASIFTATSSSSSSSSSSVPANQPPVAAIDFKLEQVRCGQVYGNASGLRSYDPDGDSLAYRWEVVESSTPLVFSEPEIRFFMQPPFYYTIKLTVSDGKGGISTTSIQRNNTYSDYCVSSSSSSRSSVKSSSSIPDASSPASSSSKSSIRSSSSSARTSSSSSVAQVAKAQCSYQIQSQWGNGFTAVIRIKNTATTVIDGWNVNWQYSDGSKVTSLWNASLSGANPYNAKNLGWNARIQPGQTVEFGFQGSKPAGAASVPAVTGTHCQ